ncbi:MAG: hypothetical protein K2O15_04575 [Lachnospiraceae bacterium]|nr:hypothetical protein [Lachnospiraceae bacterium]
MQNRKKKKPTTRNQHNNQRNNKKKISFEDLLEDDRFDDEDYDTVTGDTLEFLSLDDDMIEAYQKEHSSKSGKKGRKRLSLPKRRPARHAEKVYDEDYEDEVIYEDEEDDEDYEDEAAYED